MSVIKDKLRDAREVHHLVELDFQGLTKRYAHGPGGITVPNRYWDEQDFETYTEVDPAAFITVHSKSLASFNAMTKNVDAYLYYDFGKDYFDGNFKFQFETEIEAPAGTSVVFLCTVSDYLEEIVAIKAANKNYISVYVGSDGAGNGEISLQEHDDVNPLVTDTYICSLDVKYYLTMWRDMAVGASGTAYCEIYSDPDRTLLLSRLSVTLTNKRSYQYLFAIVSFNSAIVIINITGTIENLEMLVAGTPKLFDGLMLNELNLGPTFDISTPKYSVQTTKIDIANRDRLQDEERHRRLDGQKGDIYLWTPGLEWHDIDTEGKLFRGIFRKDYHDKFKYSFYLDELSKSRFKTVPGVLIDDDTWPEHRKTGYGGSVAHKPEPVIFGDWPKGVPLLCVDTSDLVYLLGRGMIESTDADYNNGVENITGKEGSIIDPANYVVYPSAVDGQGNVVATMVHRLTLWICDAATDTIYHIDSVGTLISSFLTTGFDAAATSPAGISVAADGTLWICDSQTNKIYHVEGTGGDLLGVFAVAAYHAAATSPAGISVAADGTLWICDWQTDTIYHVESNGALISSFAIAAYDAAATEPEGISVAADGTLWICDNTTNKIYHVESNGSLISSFAVAAYDAAAITPAGISVAADGTLWICDAGTDKIYHVESDGTLISSFLTTVFDVNAVVPQGVSIAGDVYTGPREPLSCSTRALIDGSGEITGTVDALIEHPADIVHWLMIYASDLELDEMDITSIETLKQLVPGAKFATIINSQVDALVLIDRLLSQVQAARIPRQGKIGVMTFDVDAVLVEWYKQYDFLGKTVKISQTPQNLLCNTLKVLYGLNPTTGQYEKALTRDRVNNPDCAKSYYQYGETAQVTWPLPDVQNENTAIQCADRWLKMRAFRHDFLEVSVPYWMGFDVLEGDGGLITCEEGPSEKGESDIPQWQRQKFLTYTEVDTGGFVSVDSNKQITVNAMDENNDTYVYRDFGRNYFDGDFEFKVDVTLNAADNLARLYSVMLANVVDDARGIEVGVGDYINILLYRSAATYYIYMQEIDGGATTNDSWNGVVLNTPYYLTILRDEAVGTFGTLYCEIYSDSGRTTLLHTLSIALHTSKKDFRYLYAVNSSNRGVGPTITAVISNLRMRLPDRPIGWVDEPMLLVERKLRHNDIYQKWWRIGVD